MGNRLRTRPSFADVMDYEARHGRSLETMNGGRMIEAIEAVAVEQLIGSTELPRHMTPSRDDFEALGFRFGATTDELFTSATFPPGWRYVPTENTRSANIVDDASRPRVRVIYKAAPHDTFAEALLLP